MFRHYSLVSLGISESFIRAPTPPPAGSKGSTTLSSVEVAHHATLTAVPAESADGVRQLVGPSGSFSCTSGVGFPGSFLLGAWVPGMFPFEVPENSATPLEAGSVLVLQMHYHPTGTDHAPDQTAVTLRLQDEQPEKTFRFIARGNAWAAPDLQPGEYDEGTPRFLIPAGVADHAERMEYVLDLGAKGEEKIPLVAVLPHMHLVGRSMQVRVERANPAEGEPKDECLVNVKDWDFDWQRSYTYAGPPQSQPTLANGDTIRLECSFDNTLANEGVQRLLAEEGLSSPIDVALGDDSSDEMCIALFGIVF